MKRFHLVAALLLTVVAGCAPINQNPPPIGEHPVVYVVKTDGCYSSDIFFENSWGSESVDTVRTPNHGWSYGFTPRPGQQLHISGQHVCNSRASITVAIYRDGRLVDRGRSVGPYAMAIASASY